MERRRQRSEQLHLPIISVTHSLGRFSFTLGENLGDMWYSDLLPSRSKHKKHKRKPNPALDAFISDAFQLGLCTLPPNNNEVLQDVRTLVTVGLYVHKPSLAQKFGAKPNSPHIMIRYKEAMYNEQTHTIQLFDGRYGFVELDEMRKLGYEIVVM